MNREELFLRGLFQGDEETDEAFGERVASVKTGTVVDLRDVFGFTVDWMEVEEGSAGLMPWHGGGTWIGEGKAIVRVGRKGDREEILRHEAVHVARMGFKEGRFEEIFAYMTSKSQWRRYLGPLFRKPWQAWLFLISSLCSFLYWPLPFMTLGFLGLQLYSDRRILTRCLHVLKKTNPNPLEAAIKLSDKEIIKLSNNFR